MTTRKISDVLARWALELLGHDVPVQHCPAQHRRSSGWNAKAILAGHSVVVCNDILEWGRWLETADRTVADTTVWGERVSTVFLGIDYSFDDGPPLWFETMVFGVSPLGGVQVRYTTWDEAEAGHTAIVERVKAAATEPAD